MSYIIRNTIVLGVIFILILGVGGYFTILHFPKKIEAIDKEINQIQITLQNPQDLAFEYNRLSAKLDDMEKRWETRSKEIPPKDITGETYGYMTRAIDISGEVRLNVNYVGPTESGAYGYNKYNLKGYAPFKNLYRFLWYMESGQRLFKISNLVFKLDETKVPETQETKISVNFEMELFAYYSTMPELNIAPVSRTVTPPTVISNPFYPLILRDIPPPREDEIIITRSELLAVVTGKAFINDQNQKQRTLEEGDPVYLGYVTKISPHEGKIECLLNKGGVSEIFELYIRAGQPIK